VGQGILGEATKVATVNLRDGHGQLVPGASRGGQGVINQGHVVEQKPGWSERDRGEIVRKGGRKRERGGGGRPEGGEEPRNFVINMPNGFIQIHVPNQNLVHLRTGGG
jgi:hypothetical protein